MQAFFVFGVFVSIACLLDGHHLSGVIPHMLGAPKLTLTHDEVQWRKS